MAASMNSNSYEKWLTEKLLSLNPDTDTDVFVTYMTGILEEDGSEEEKKESLMDFIGQVVEENQEAVYTELMEKWKQTMSGEETSKTETSSSLTNHLTSILDQQKIAAVKPKEKTAEEIARKKAILENYSACSDGEGDESDDPGGTSAAEGKGDNLYDFKNVNSELVKVQEQELREKSKQESDRKKEKDKQDREAQKQKSKDRKESEKKRTQKGERRR